MTVTATVEQDVRQNGNRRITVRFDDDVDSSISRDTFLIGLVVDAQAFADVQAANLEQSRAEIEKQTNFELVRDGQDATTLVWVRNTVDVGDEWICKGASNQTTADNVAAFAHIHREYSNARIVAVTGLTNAQRQAWSGQAQAIENALMQYEDNHTADPAFFFEGFPEN